MSRSPQELQRASCLGIAVGSAHYGLRGVFLGAGGEEEFNQIASGGCRNRDGDFIIRGLVSNANEDTVVLSDPDDSRDTMSLSLPGRGPLQRVKGVIGENKHEATRRAPTGPRARRRNAAMSG